MKISYVHNAEIHVNKQAHVCAGMVCSFQIIYRALKFHCDDYYGLSEVLLDGIYIENQSHTVSE